MGIRRTLLQERRRAADISRPNFGLTSAAARWIYSAMARQRPRPAPGSKERPQLRLVARTEVPTDDQPKRRLVAAGLFAGIGGIELGLRRAGHETSLLCENDPGAARVLAKRFPDVAKSYDVRDLKRLPKGTTLVAAGFPCQDLSQAGKTAGIAGAKSGLVGEVFRLLRKTRIPWVLLENVPFMLQLSKGRALEVIVAALEDLGYRWAYRIIDSRAFGVPQRRERVYLLASLEGDPRDVILSGDAGVPAREEYSRERAFGFYWTEGTRGLGAAVNAVPTLKGGSTIGIPSAPAILLPSGDVVMPDVTDCERMQGFDLDWTRPAEDVSRRTHRSKLVGNAVTVDTAEWIGHKLASPVVYSHSWDDLPIVPGNPWPRAAWSDGKGRFASAASPWPEHLPRPRLDEFLRTPCQLLSARATSGFLSRARVASLRFPDGFLDALDAHLARMQAAATA